MQEDIEAIFLLRAKNNILWKNAIVRLAELDPMFFKKWQNDVRAIDREIYERNGKLCE